jgi:predicted membrane metal-binding protein
MSFELFNLLHHGPEICQRFLPTSKFYDLYSALICGTSLQTGSYRRIFLDTGLIHILVVSGAHLHFLDRILKVVPKVGRLTLLGIYGWLCGFQAPVVRAWLRRVVEFFGFPRGASSFQNEAITVLILLAVIPHWISSRSLLMCWVCALALSLPPLWPRWPAMSTSFWCYILLLPLCPSAPTSLLANILLTPLIGVILFPLSLLACLSSHVAHLADCLWSALFLVLDQMPQVAPPPWPARPWFWIYPLLLHILLLRGEVLWRREQAFSS